MASLIINKQEALERDADSSVLHSILDGTIDDNITKTEPDDTILITNHEPNLIEANTFHPSKSPSKIQKYVVPQNKNHY